MKALRTFSLQLEKPVSIAPLITFRILFGALMITSTIRFMAFGWIDDHYVKPILHFKYFGFSWIEPLPEFWMYTVHVIMIVAAVGVMIGYYYRLASIVLFLTFTYTELIDLTYYLNHYYFVSLISALMIFLPANRFFSIDAWRHPALTSSVVPAWTIYVIKFQLAIVYIYAGLAKINYDWLILALPMKIWLPASDKLPFIGKILTWKWIPYAFSWIGMIYDCTIVIWLSVRKTRIAAYISVVIFHVITGILFQIGVFPIVMVAAALIFFSPEWHEKLITKLATLFKNTSSHKGPSFSQIAQRNQNPNTLKVTYLILMIYCFVQIVFPWRYLLYPGNLFWTEEGYRFSWRVMLMEKAGTATFYVKDTRTGREGMVMNEEFLNPHQEKQMAMQPDMILQYAHFLKEHYERKGITDPSVRAEVYVTLNARPAQLLIDPNVNLAAANDSWKSKDWILPYQE